MRTWGPTYWGKLFTTTKAWMLTLDGANALIHMDGKRFPIKVSVANPISVNPGRFWASISFTLKGMGPIKLDGISNADANDMQRALESNADPRLVIELSALRLQQLATYDKAK